MLEGGGKALHRLVSDLPLVKGEENAVKIKLKRIYEEYSSHDGYRILVDRLWPRGVSRDNAHVDEWLKEISPSAELRKWFAHDPERWKEFARRYQAELELNHEQVGQLYELISREKVVTLLYAAKDDQHNNAVVLKNFIDAWPQPKKKAV
jgi:uncharacterized protein YeaO (DUF488 family)